jgi:tetratricopeptide (TPR) repeat protein
MRPRTAASLAIVCSAALAGCRLPGFGPSSRGLAASRQLAEQGAAAMERGQWDRAETLLSQAVRACPDNPDARRGYAEALWNRGGRQDAVSQLGEAVRSHPEEATLHVRMAEMRLATGSADTAQESAARAVRLAPKLAEGWAVYGRVMQARQRPQEALASFQRALALAPSDRQVPLQIAQLYTDLGQPQRALATLQGLADQYAPGEEPHQVLYQEGLAHLALARYEDAVESLAAASTRPHAGPETLFGLAQAELAAGHPARAAASAREALALDPKHQPSLELIERIELARLDLGHTQR